ncbi:MAG: RnfABCDGE type electron transport complex subunit G [Pseudomonadota bacterium]
MKDIFRMVVVLGVICALAGLALAGVRDFTRAPIELQVMKNIQGPAIMSVLEGYDNDPIADNFKLPGGVDKKGRPVEKAVFPAKKDGKLIALALDSAGRGFDGNIGVMVGIDPSGKLTGIAIMKHTETPGIGSRITLPAFTDQFRGKNLESPTDVDGVSGATYSTKGVFAAISSAVEFYLKNKDQILASAGK